MEKEIFNEDQLLKNFNIEEMEERLEMTGDPTHWFVSFVTVSFWFWSF